MPRKKKKTSENQTPEAQWKEDEKKKQAVLKAIGKTKEYHSSLKGIEVETVLNPLSEEPPKRILTGTALDRILSRSNGIEEGSTCEFYGEYASGKTQVCMALAAEAIVMGLVIFIDSEHTFRGDRFREICESRGIDVEKHAENLLLYRPEDWIEQEAITLQLPEFDENGELYEVRLVVVDSLMKHWASSPEFYGRENLTNRQQLVRAQLERLARYARRHGAVLVYTNQIYDKPVDTAFAPLEARVGSRGGRTVEHIGDYRLFFRKGRGNLRYARLVDSPDIPLLEVPFVLEVSGIMDIVNPVERASAILLSEKYGEKFLNTSVTGKAPPKEAIMKALELGYITEEEARNQDLSEKQIKKAIDAQMKTMEDRLSELKEELTQEEREILGEEEPDE